MQHPLVVKAYSLFFSVIVIPCYAQVSSLDLDTKELNIPVIEVQKGSRKFYVDTTFLGNSTLTSFDVIGVKVLNFLEYDRATWPHWDDFDGDCQNTRHELLISTSQVNVSFTSSSQCTIPILQVWGTPGVGSASRGFEL